MRIKWAIILLGIFLVITSFLCYITMKDYVLLEYAEDDKLEVLKKIEKDNTPVDPELININTADILLLQTLPGIGKSKAVAIIQYREKNGEFSSIDEIKKVSGIGDKTFDIFKNMITN